MRESPLAFSSGVLLLALGLTIWAKLSAPEIATSERVETKNSTPAPGEGTATAVSGKANKTTFARAINTALATQCIQVDLHSMGVTTFPAGIPDDQANSQQYAALAKAGLLTAVAGQVKRPDVVGVTPPIVPGKTYSLTGTGKAALRGNGVDFCAGHYEVDQVLQFTVPGNAIMGTTVSEVDFTYNARDVPPWATNRDVQSAFPDLTKEIASGQHGSAEMVLTNDGWRANLSNFMF
jgi:hypothetical protein